MFCIFDFSATERVHIVSFLNMEVVTDKMVGVQFDIHANTARLSEVYEPLRNLTHKDARWVLGKDHDKSFADLQKTNWGAPVLNYFDHKAATEGQAHASSKGLGFVLCKRDVACHMQAEPSLVRALRVRN